MTITLHKNLTVILLLVAVLLAPFNSFAHEVTSGAAPDSCACHLQLTDCGGDAVGDQPNHSPDNNAADCCDCEEAPEDAAEQPLSCDLSLNISARPLFPQRANNCIPTVYLTIFVPPQSFK